MDVDSGDVLTDGDVGADRALDAADEGADGPPWASHRQVVEGAINRLRAGIGWRDLAREFRAFSMVNRLAGLARQGKPAAPPADATGSQGEPV